MKRNNIITCIFNYSFLVIASGSMEPVLNIGDVIIVSNSISYDVGDIVTYKSNDIYITHEIININDDYVITKGINNSIPDNPVKKSEIVYKYVRTSIILTRIFKIIDTLSFKIIIILFTVLFIIHYFYLFIKNFRREVLK